VTQYGGANDFGEVFELSPGNGGWALTVLHSFLFQSKLLRWRGTIGALTYAGAETGAPYDGTSPLYGVSTNGGCNSHCEGGQGTVYSIQPGKTGWTLQTLYSFADGSSQIYPTGGLAIDPKGNLSGRSRTGAWKGKECSS